jgi:F420-0:gamma-glutamyl ligase-like protein
MGDPSEGYASIGIINILKAKGDKECHRYHLIGNTRSLARKWPPHLAKSQQMTWQSLLEYARIAWDNARKNVDKVAIYDDVIENFGKLRGEKELLH